jgi:hypothetical protein
MNRAAKRSTELADLETVGTKGQRQSARGEPETREEVAHLGMTSFVDIVRCLEGSMSDQRWSTRERLVEKATHCRCVWYADTPTRSSKILNAFRSDGPTSRSSSAANLS